MTFNSPEFLLFLVAVLVIHYGVLPAQPAWPRKVWLVAASHLFYACWAPTFEVLLLLATVVDFWVGRTMAATATPGRRRVLLLVSITSNLSLLGFFKYAGFFAGIVHAVSGAPGDPSLLDVVLPVGISFYTFESLSYVVDVYRGERPARRLLDFALFLSFFPHLVAGPIVRPRDFLPQLDAPSLPDRVTIERGLARIAQGFAKKLLLADGLGVYVDYVWRDPAGLGAGNLLLATYAYAFQIYGDFSGYTDIALGVASLFGYRLPENFDRPYVSASPQEFWRRWHISLSTWLRDYLYIPLGGGRGSELTTARNLMITMALGGLWHGAAWPFVLWGVYHGVLLVGQRALGRDGPSAGGGGLMARILTFHLVCFGWIVFRAPTLEAVGEFLSGFGSLAYEPSRAATQAAVLTVLAAGAHALPASARLRDRWTALPPALQGVGYAAVTLACALLAPGGDRFIYFQF